MKLASVLIEAKNKQFNCSKGAELLADQPTKDEESHAHIHSLDPFKVDVGKIKPEGFKAPSRPVFATANPAFTSLVQERKKFWENPELHLHPEASHPHKSQLYDDSSAPSGFKVYEFYLDRTRLAVNDTYLKRGMAEIAEQQKVTYSQQLIYTEAGGKKSSTVFPLTGKTDKAVLPTGATLVKDLGVKETVTKIHPNYLAMEKHTMFEDSEVLVMATTGALLSDAGLLALSELETRPEGHYVAVFSASAVKAVDATFKKHKPLEPSLKLVERSPQSVKVDTSDKQPKVVTEGARYDKVEMKRVVLVMKKNALSDLVVVTCYPSQNHPAVKPPTPPPAPEDDVIELDKATATYRVLKQVGAIELKW